MDNSDNSVKSGNSLGFVCVGKGKGVLKGPTVIHKGLENKRAL